MTRHITRTCELRNPRFDFHSKFQHYIYPQTRRRRELSDVKRVTRKSQRGVILESETDIPNSEILVLGPSIRN